MRRLTRCLFSSLLGRSRSFCRLSAGSWSSNRWGVRVSRASGLIFAFLLALAVCDSAPGQRKGAVGNATPAARRTIGEKPSPGQGAYNAAANIQNNGEYALAAKEWQQFLRKYPKDKLAPQATHYLGVCFLQQGDFAEAEKVFDQVVRGGRGFEFIDESHLNLGWCQYSRAVGGEATQFLPAERTFREFLQQRKTSKLRDQALFYLGECLYLQGKRQEALPIYRQLVKEYPDSQLRVDALYALGVAQQELGKYRAAITTFDTFLNDFPRHELATEILMRKGESFIHQQNYVGGEKIFAQVIQDRDFADFNPSLFRHAFCVLKQNRYREAAELYARIPSELKDPQFAPAAQVYAGQAYFKAGDSESAKRWLMKAADSPTAGSEAAHWLSRIALKDRDFQLAHETASAAISKVKPTDANLPALELDLADALSELDHRKAEALAIYRKIANEHPKSKFAPQALYSAAYTLMEMEQYGEAIETAQDFEKRFTDVEWTPDAQYVLAESHLLNGDHEKAEKIYAHLVADFPGHKHNRLWRLRQMAAMQVQERHEDVIKIAKEQLSELKDPKQIAEAHYLMGYSLNKLDRNDEAVNAYEASLRASTNWRRADDTVLQLSQTLTALGKQDEAANVFTRYKTSVENSDRPDAIRYQLAETNYENDNYAEALQDYDAILTKWPESEFAASAMFGKGWSEFKLGKPADAVGSFSDLIDTHRESELVPRAYRARAMCRQLSGDAHGGLADVIQYMATNPPESGRAEAYYVRGLCELALQQARNARVSFELILEKYPDYNRRDRVLYELGWLYKSSNEEDRAAEKFAQLVKEHGESRLVAEASYHVGEHAYDRNEFDNAISAYSAALAAHPSDAIGERAYYKRGWSEYQQKAFAAALGSFRSQIQRFGQGKLSADARFMIGECLFSLKKYAETMDNLKEVNIVALPEHSQVLARLHAGQAALQLQNWQSAIDLLEPIVSEDQTSVLANKAAFELARAHQGLDQTDRAETLYKQAADATQDATAACSRFMLGELYFARKDFEPALHEFQRLMYGFEDDKTTDGVKKWQAKAGLEAGRVAEILAGQTNDQSERADYVARAKKYFEYVVEQHGETSDAKTAAEQLRKIGS